MFSREWTQEFQVSNFHLHNESSDICPFLNFTSITDKYFISPFLNHFSFFLCLVGAGKFFSLFEFFFTLYNYIYNKRHGHKIINFVQNMFDICLLSLPYHLPNEFLSHLSVFPVREYQDTDEDEHVVLSALNLFHFEY